MWVEIGKIVLTTIRADRFVDMISIWGWGMVEFTLKNLKNYTRVRPCVHLQGIPFKDCFVFRVSLFVFVVLEGPFRMRLECLCCCAWGYVGGVFSWNGNVYACDFMCVCVCFTLACVFPKSFCFWGRNRIKNVYSPHTHVYSSECV